MTAISFSQLPLAAGGALASSAGRASMWTLSRFMRAPLANSAILAMVTMTAMAGSNALYRQTIHHPAPLFAPSPDVPMAVTAAPVVPVVREHAPAPAAVLPATPSNETTGSVAPVVQQLPEGPVGNSDVYEVQKRLYELGLFQGTVDGYYGPMTAKAIRAFEQLNGFKPLGAVSPGIVDAIVHSDAQGRAVVAPQPVAVAPRPAPQPMVQEIVAPRPQPAPAVDRVVARLPNIEPQDQIGEALSTVAESAAGTIDSIVASVDGGRTLPAAPAIKPMPSVPVIAQPMPNALQPVAVAPVEQVRTPVANVPATGNVNLTAKVQRGLASLGFLHGPIDGQAGETTARAIRNFEVYYNYDVTGQVSPQLVDMLVAAGASV